MPIGNEVAAAAKAPTATPTRPADGLTLILGHVLFKIVSHRQSGQSHCVFECR